MPKLIKYLFIGAGLLAVLYGISVMYPGPAKAADLGGNCCADLEERIAELEATTARKGNRKMTLTITGQINKAVLYYDGLYDDSSDTRVIENSASETYVAITGAAQIRPGLLAGYTIEIGQGLADDGLTLAGEDLYTRQSFVFVKSERWGGVSIGLQSTATDDLTHQSVANTTAASKRLTLQPVGGEVTEIFNGRKANAVRYTSPTVSGFQASAAWDSDTDGWDAALRYAGEFGGLQVVAAAGYLDRNEDGLFEVVDARTVTLNAGIKHITTGLFVQASWARIDVDEFNATFTVPGDDYDAFHVQAGIERQWFENMGPTTLFGEYADWGYGEVVLDANGIPVDTLGSELKFYGVGLNQNLAGAVDLYLLYRHYDFDPGAVLPDDTADTVLGGARINF